MLLAVGLWTLASTAIVIFPPLWLPAIVALLLLAGLSVWDWRMVSAQTVTAGRELPERAYVGRAASITLLLRNDGPMRLRADIYEDVPQDLADNDIDFRGIDLPPGREARVSYEIVPRRRGDRPLGKTIGFVATAIGLVQRRVVVAASQPLAVYPDTTRFVRPETLNPRRLLALLGVKEARRRGEGMELDSLRDYVPGDDPRWIHWPASARRGRPVVRRNRHEHNHSVIIAVDCSRLMGSRVDERNKLDHAVDAALALAYTSISCSDRVSVVVFDRDVRGCWARRGARSDFAPLVELLRRAEPVLAEPNYRRLVREVSTKQQRSAFVVILTDFVEVAAGSLIDPLSILARRHRTLLVAIRDRVYRKWDDGDSIDSDPLDVYRRLVLHDLLRERETALGTLRRRGLQTLDLPATQLTVPVLNRYLAMRYGPV